MKKNSREYTNWLIKKNKKNLRKRTEKKRKLRAKRRYKNHVRNESQIIQYPKKKNKRITIIAPENFSIIDNSEETLAFFSKMLKNKDKTIEIFVDISRIRNLTIEALMYLLAIIYNLKGIHSFSVSGNIPQDLSVKKKFEQSGFLHYVHANYLPYRGLSKTSNSFQIQSGEKTDVSIASQLTDFIAQHSGIDGKYLRFFYIMIIELMSNTSKHAYEEQGGSLFQPLWYCYADYLDKEEKICMSFLDLGLGIPVTVKRKWYEHILQKNDCEYIVSALNGENRSETGMPNRGKGLPQIAEYCHLGYIDAMRIISESADVGVLKETMIQRRVSLSFKGTLFYWELDINSLKRELKICIK